MENVIIDNRLIGIDIYRLLSLCFDFPSKEKMDDIREISTEIVKNSDESSPVFTCIKNLHACIDENEALKDYSNIFIKGGVPLSESFTLQKFTAVADVSAFYKAFGFTPRSGENPDSISYQLEFLALLMLKQVIAPNKEAIEVTEKAYSGFLKEHTSEFAIALARRIKEGNAGSYFIAVSNLLEAFTQSELNKTEKSNGK